MKYLPLLFYILFLNHSFHNMKDKNLNLLNHYLYLPDNYNSKDKWPLILFLHGSGERGDSLALIKKWGIPKLVDTMQIPFVVVSPQCPADEVWNVKKLKKLLDHVINKHKIDTQQIYATGLSLGGIASYELAIKYPNLFAAIAPLSARGNIPKASKIAHIPVWAFHGAKDEVIPLKNGQDMVDAINNKGGNAKMTVFKEAGHVCWDTVYSDNKFYDWLLSNKKNKK